MGFIRKGGVTQPLKAELNGEPIVVDTGDANEFSEFFAPLDADVPTSIVQGKNKVVVTAQDGTTITSVQLVTYHSAEAKPRSRAQNVPMRALQPQKKRGR